MTVTTPTVGTSFRRSAGWIAIGVVAVLVAVFLLLNSTPDVGAGRALDPENPGPTGAMALARVLDDRGVEVVTVDTFDAAREAASGESVTVLFDDSTYFALDSDHLTELTGLGDHLVLLEPTQWQLDDIVPGARVGSVTEGAADSDCEARPVERAGSVSIGGTGYSYDGDEDAVLCLDSGDGHAYIEIEGDTTISILGAGESLSNEAIAERGNAAFALGVLGTGERLVWYTPSLADYGQGQESVGSLTPDWVTPAIVLLILVVVAAGVWQGRRMGALVVEDLPVTVRASETMEGRARLYERSAARLRALDALRVGTIGRLATILGFPGTADVETVITGTAELLQRDPAIIRALLLTHEPQSDRAMITASDELLELERAAGRVARPDSSPTTQPQGRTTR